MTEIMQSSSTSCSIQQSPTRSINDGLYQQQHTHLLTSSSSSSFPSSCLSLERKRRRQSSEEEESDQLNILRLFLTSVRRSVLGCSSSSSCEIVGKRMEIGWPSNVRHVAHVTFDRFNGFLGLPVEFEPDVPRRAPSASTTVFGVSTNSMQLSFDARGNSVPTILLLMQNRLYALGGLQIEGIFRINADNGQEEYVRDQLNRGLVPDDVDIHCLAGLIKAWFRELPTGVLDCLSPEQVMESQTEEECTRLARLLPPTEAALLDWAINLMADVAQCEHLNKMNARNVAMVFAPNMTHMADPLTALMHAVQVMNFLKTLVEKTLKEREDSILDSALDSSSRDPSAGSSSSYNAPLQTIQEETTNADEHENDQPSPKPVETQDGLLIINENIEPDENEQQRDKSAQSGSKECRFVSNCGKSSSKGLNKPCYGTGKAPRKTKVLSQVAKTKGTNLVSNMNLRTPERIEAWR